MKSAGKLKGIRLIFSAFCHFLVTRPFHAGDRWVRAVLRAPLSADWDPMRPQATLELSVNFTVPAEGWPIYRKAPPHIRLAWDDGRAQMHGKPDCKLGRPVPGRAGLPEEGVFAWWHWDGAGLEAGVDPLGFYSLFLYQKGEEVALSPSILQLIAEGADPELDERALAVFYRLGMFVNGDTPFRYIKVLPPGGVFRWRDGRAEQPQDHSFIPRVQQISRAEAVEGIVTLARDSVGRILDDWDQPVLLPLSGGRDSRHILLAMDHLGQRPELCVSFQNAAMRVDPDAQSARALCERMGVAHKILGKPRMRPQDLLRCQVLNSLCSDEHMQMLALHDFLFGGPWAVLDGIAGDILTNPDDDAEGHMRHAERGDYAAIARDMMDGHARVISKPGYPDGPGSRYAPGRRDEAIAYVGDCIARYGEAADPYQAWWFWNRTRREIGFVSSSIFGSAQAVFCPFLAPDYVRFGLSLPYAVTRDQQLHNQALAKAYPAYADVPFSEGIAPVYGAGSLALKLGMVVKGVALLLRLKPQHPLAEALGYLRGDAVLKRRPGEVLQLHHLILSGLDATLARELLALGPRYAAYGRRNEVLDSFVPA